MSSIIDLDCSICYDRFKDPRILKCGHTFCFSCLSQIQVQPRRNGIPCPECKLVTEIPNGVSKLTVNWTVKKTIDSVEESSAAQSSRIPLCQIHNMPPVLYCQKCIVLVCSKCLGSHSDHLGDIGPLDDAISSNGTFISTVVDKLISRMTQLTIGASFWELYLDRLSSSEKIQLAELDHFDKLILKMKQKHEALRSEIKSSYEQKTSEIRKSLASVVASRYELHAVLEKLSSVPPTSKVSSVWSLVTESEDLLIAHPAPTNFPDLETVMVDTVKLDTVDDIQELASTYAIQRTKLPDHPKLVREYDVTFSKVSSVKNRTESSATAFGRITVSIIMIPRGTKAEQNDKVGLYLKFRCPAGLRFGMRYGLTIMNQQRPTKSIKLVNESTVQNNGYAGWGDFAESDLILNPANGFCVNDIIQVRGVFEVHRTWFQPKDLLGSERK